MADTNNLIERYGLRGTPAAGLWMGTWGFFIGFAAFASGIEGEPHEPVPSADGITVLTGGADRIDQAMKLGANHPIGPLALCDLVGLDVELAVMQVLFEGFKDPKYRPAPLLVEMVEAGYLGRKTGRGFFTYG